MRGASSMYRTLEAIRQLSAACTDYLVLAYISYGASQLYGSMAFRVYGIAPPSGYYDCP